MNWMIDEAMKRKQYTSNITQLEQEALDRGDFLYMDEPEYTLPLTNFDEAGTWDNPTYDESDEIDRLVKQIKALNLLLSELNEDIETTYKMNRAMAKLLKKLL